ncbi:MAG: class I SAM-dependent methyltransferase [Synechococcus sp.]|nr:class I SAM-dependent methyltransferase [Synechococcus sp.]
MAGSPFRQLAYRYRWIYDTVTATSALSVGGVDRLRSLAAEWLLPQLADGAPVLDLCCGSGEAAAPLLRSGAVVTGLDIAPRALELAASRYPQLQLVEGLAEDPPLADASFAGIQLSLALHEFPAAERRQLLRSARRLVRPDGAFVLVDLHPATGVMQPLQQLFCALFETETATAFLQLDLEQELASCGWQVAKRECLAGSALQRVLCRPA